jgi:hypothetical protein
VEKDVNHQNVNWLEYFTGIRAECPWSYSAYLQGAIDIREYTGEIQPLGKYQARVYTVLDPSQSVKALSAALDHGEDEWLYSFPGYGPFATPVPVLIQQNRAKLNELRQQSKEPS